MFEVCILIGLSRLLDTDLAYEMDIKNITTGNWLRARNHLSCRTVVNPSSDGDNRHMDGR